MNKICRSVQASKFQVSSLLRWQTGCLSRRCLRVLMGVGDLDLLRWLSTSYSARTASWKKRRSQGGLVRCCQEREGAVGDDEGISVGLTEGASLGVEEEADVLGAMLGVVVGEAVPVGTAVGDDEEISVGLSDGASLGVEEEADVLGAMLGVVVGEAVPVGDDEEISVGLSDGASLDVEEEAEVLGAMLGVVVGEAVP
eukprot:scaffold1598_cov153-Ochromonas_danica.AAC.5